jgi:hypothetical protein
MEHIIAGYLREIWEMKGRLYGFRPRYSCGSQVVTVCQDIADSLDERVSTDAIIMDFSTDFCLVLNVKLLRKIATTGLDLRVVLCVKEFFLRRSQIE